MSLLATAEAPGTLGLAQAQATLKDADRYCRWLTWATVPLHFVALIACPWWAGTQHLSRWALLLLAYVAGTDAGLGLNTAHELGHKTHPVEPWLARLALAVPAYGPCAVAVVQGDGPAAAGPAPDPARPVTRQHRPRCPRKAGQALRQTGRRNSLTPRRGHGSCDTGGR